MTFNIVNFQKINDFIEKNTVKPIKKPSIVCISKNHSVSSINTALKHGIRIFGENKVQEAISKFSTVKKNFRDLELHLTGPLQTNKVKQALNIFDFFHTLDREKLALAFIKYLPRKSEKFSKKFFIQINTGMENQKSGIFPNNATEFIKFCTNDLNLPVIGLMCIPPINEDPEPHFVLLRKLSIKNNLQFLSMGMSSDFKLAILNGSTHIRIGTLLFGTR